MALLTLRWRWRRGGFFHRSCGGRGRRRARRDAEEAHLGRRRCGGGPNVRDRFKALNLGALQQFIDQLFDAGQLAPLLGGDERVGDPFAAHPAGAADAMHVIVADLRGHRS